MCLSEKQMHEIQSIYFECVYWAISSLSCRYFEMDHLTQCFTFDRWIQKIPNDLLIIESFKMTWTKWNGYACNLLRCFSYINRICFLFLWIWNGYKKAAELPSEQRQYTLYFFFSKGINSRKRKRYVHSMTLFVSVKNCS